MLLLLTIHSSHISNKRRRSSTEIYLWASPAEGQGPGFRVYALPCKPGKHQNFKKDVKWQKHPSDMNMVRLRRKGSSQGLMKSWSEKEVCGMKMGETRLRHALKDPVKTSGQHGKGEAEGTSQRWVCSFSLLHCTPSGHMQNERHRSKNLVP